MSKIELCIAKILSGLPTFYISDCDARDVISEGFLVSSDFLTIL
jgi:hypothetical protein